ncbi:ATP-binding protein [Pandoraea cepalis]|uniref:DNA mismatch repair protein MutL n=1 Tax=Pandoraea cepalis TaxID=2508294 RepID=A0A5E4YQX0_9BURK|nr:ATP-binding protein [Pandoraea cepalis]VVE50313.1 DNA mismatch repair protein MutL [Pandoraea cepalis]
MDTQGLLYEDRFLESWAGAIITTPSTAIVELVANAWDAYATKVDITLPDAKNNVQFSITDNGKGMTLAEFQYIWRAMSYDRIAKFGPTTEPPADVSGPPRAVFGRNGKGRFASFCFAGAYQVTSKKDGEQFTVRVSRTPSNPLVFEELEHIPEGVAGHGTEIRGCGEIPYHQFSNEQARQLLGSRFLANPAFEVFLNETKITFNDIPSACLSVVEVEIDGIGKATIYHIDTLKADKSTKQHGIAWWVLNRAFDLS